MALNDDDMEAMVMLLRDKTHLVRFNASEVEAVLRFMESQGADLKPEAPAPWPETDAEPEVVTIPREESE